MGRIFEATRHTISTIVLALLVWSHLQQPARGEQRAVEELRQAAQRAYEASDYGTAIKLGQAALEKAQKRLGKRHPQVADLAFEVGKSLHAQGDLTGAEPMFRTSLDIWEKQGGRGRQNVGYSAWWLGKALNGLGRHVEAEAPLKRAAEILVRGQGNADAASVQHDLGWSLRFQNKNEESIPFYEQALASRRHVLGERNNDTASTAQHLAWAYHGAGRNEEAARLFRAAIEVKQELLGADHIDVGWASEGAARSLIDRKMFREAQPFAEREVAIKERYYGGDHIETALALHRLGNTLRRQGQHESARPHLFRALAIKEKARGPEDIEVAYTLQELGWTSAHMLRLKEAGEQFRRTLAIKERHFGPDHIQVAWALDGLLMVHIYGSEYEAAERVARRSLEIKRNQSLADDQNMIEGLDVLAVALHRSGRIADAIRLLEEAMQIVEASPRTTPVLRAQQLGLIAVANFDKGDMVTAEAQIRKGMALLEQAGATSDSSYYSYHQLLGKVLTQFSRYDEAEAEVRKVIEAHGKVQSVHIRDVMDALNTLAIIYTGQDRYEQAEQALKRSLALAEQTFGENSVDVAQVLENLAHLYATVERLEEAMGLLDRTLAIRKTVLSPNHALVGSTHAVRAGILNSLQRYKDAEDDARNALRIFAPVYGDKYTIGLVTRDVLATALRGLQRYAEAVLTLEEAIRITIDYEGEQSQRLPTLWHNLGFTLVELGRYDEAQAAYQRSLKERGERFARRDTLGEAQTHKVLGDLFARQGRWSDALSSYRQANASFIEAVKRAGAGGREYLGRNWLRVTSFEHIHSLWNVANTDAPGRPALAAEGFEIAQWLMRTAAAAALAQVGVRQAATSPELSAKIRERQDNLRRSQQLDAQLSKLLTEPIEKRDDRRVADLRKAIAELEDALGPLNELLSTQFPAFAELSNPTPLSVDQTQRLLKADEVLIQYLVLNGYTLAWIITPSSIEWFKIALTWRDLSDRVEALRCGFDQTAWRIEVRARRCQELLKAASENYRLPFNFEVAHTLYTHLLGPAEHLIKDKQLLVATSGILTGLPFHVLVTEKPKEAYAGSDSDYRDIAWLAKKVAITLVPSVSSLRVQRAIQHSRPATREFLGIGDPILSEGGSCPETTVPQSCPTQAVTVAALDPRGIVQRSGAGSDALRMVFRNGLAMPAAVRSLCRLPDTAYELGCVAKSLGVPESEIIVGARATETTIKELSASGVLANYRILHFATHGLLAGEHEQLVKTQAEPALVLTPPPDGASPAELAEDDGLLTASEIASLKLNADWVILSACNTAGGEKGNAESLSGLARAFFYAGARALLVSHWEVYSDAAVKLTTHAFGEMRRDTAVGRAEALRRSMAALIDKGDFSAHPSYWAPFIVVGDGGR
jgi:CHAT domain-containing protein